jgi:hypothetical protein
MRYNSQHRWIYQAHVGASLKALEELGTKKGYNLVSMEASRRSRSIRSFTRMLLCGS